MESVHEVTIDSCNKFFLSFRKMELSSGKLAKFADGSAVVQVKTKKELEFVQLQNSSVFKVIVWASESKLAISSLKKGQLYLKGKNFD